jgi:hypothetical protein
LARSFAHLGLVGGLLVFRPRLESSLADLHERVYPRLDPGLLQVVLAAHAHELPLPPDQLKE